MADIKDTDTAIHADVKTAIDSLVDDMAKMPVNDGADEIFEPQQPRPETVQTEAPAAKADKPAKGKGAKVVPMKGKEKGKPALTAIKGGKAEQAKADHEAAKTKAEEKPVKAIDGFAIAEDADIEEVAHATDEANKALGKIAGKDKDLLGAYLALGGFQHNATKWIPSSKIRGAYVAAKLPQSQNMDPSLRSNCTWLFEALNIATHEAADMLMIFGLMREGDNRKPEEIIAEYKTQNPTVIRREYKKAKEAYEAEQKAKAAGKPIEELEKEEKAAKEAQAKKDAATAKRQLTALLKRVRNMAMEHEEKEDAVTEIMDIMATMLEQKNRQDMIAYLGSL